MSIFLRDNESCDEEVVRAKKVQRKTDIYRVVYAFVELKESGVLIYKLLNDHFSIEDISEAREYISRTRIHRKIKI